MNRHGIDIVGVDESTIVKLFPEGWPVAAANREAHAARAAYDAGVPTPAVLDVVERDGRYGVVFERTDGSSLLDDLAADPTRPAVERCCAAMARLQVAIHRHDGNDLPSMHERAAGSIRRAANITAVQKRAVMEILAELPRGNQLCHGDFHPAQVIATGAGHRIIDWFDGAAGDPVADLAKTVLLLGHASLPAHLADPLAEFRPFFASHYVECFREFAPVNAEHLSGWITVHAAARLASRPPAAEKSDLQAIVDEASRGAYLS